MVTREAFNDGPFMRHLKSIRPVGTKYCCCNGVVVVGRMVVMVVVVLCAFVCMSTCLEEAWCNGECL